MAKHTVRMTEPEHDVSYSDIDFWIWAGNTQMGHLHISQGGIDWYEGKAWKTKRSISWEQFQELIVRNVEESQGIKAKKKR